jgi:two-component system, OmpR family, sensor histidine kinase BaeS
MFRSLRWKITAAFGLVILLTIAFSGGFSYWSTSTQFDVLVTDESGQRAEALIPLLEASYTYWGNWDGLDELLESYGETGFPATVFAEPWGSDVDWWAITMETLDLGDEDLWEAWEEADSLAAVADDLGIAPQVLVDAIFAAENAAVLAAVKSGELSRWEADEEIEWISELTYDFVWGSIDENWEWVDPDTDYSFVPYYSEEPYLTAAGIDWLFSALLLEHERLLVADREDWVVYDSLGEFEGEQLPPKLVKNGAILWDYDEDEPIGTAIIAAGPGYYSAQEAAFLDGVTWSLLISGVIAGIIALLVGWVIARRVTAPVTALTEATHRIAGGQWDERLPVDSEDELGQMSTAFNAMATSLETQQTLRNRLVDDVAHELNTPLSVIQLELMALEDGMQTSTEAATHVKREIQLLRSLVNDLSTLAETDEGALHLAPTQLDFGVLVSDTLVRWQSRADLVNVTLRFQSPDALPMVTADQLRMTQVLGNLIANALQHTPPGGAVEIQIESPPARLPVSVPPGNYLVVRVCDTGAGIPEDDLPHIFDRFYRVDPSRNRSTGGRGLGLAIVQQIITAHGGVVWVESSLGQGSSFGFALPLDKV